MGVVNINITKLQENYLFSEISSKVKAYKAAHPQAHVINLGIGDVTLPICPTLIKALHCAVDEMAQKETFRGYGQEQGYEFLREQIVEHDYRSRGVQISVDEVFINDGAKSDVGNIGDLFVCASRWSRFRYSG